MAIITRKIILSFQVRTLVIELHTQDLDTLATQSVYSKHQSQHWLMPHRNHYLEFSHLVSPGVSETIDSLYWVSV